MDAINKSSCENRDEIGKDIDWIYSSNTKEEALNRLKEFNKKWKRKYKNISSISTSFRKKLEKYI